MLVATSRAFINQKSFTNIIKQSFLVVLASMHKRPLDLTIELVKSQYSLGV